MKWERLKENKCPICKNEIEQINDILFICSNGLCTFSITKKRYEEIKHSFDEEAKKKTV